MVATEAAYEGFKGLGSIVVWIRNISCMLGIVQTQFLFDGAVWRGYGRCNLAGGSISVGMGFGQWMASLHFQFLSASCDISALYSCHDACHFLPCFLVMLGSLPSGGKLK